MNNARMFNDWMTNMTEQLLTEQALTKWLQYDWMSKVTERLKTKRLINGQIINYF